MLAATLTRKMHISAMGDGNMLEREKIIGISRTEKGEKKSTPK